MVAFDTIPWYFWISIGMKLVTCNKRGDLIPNLLVFHSVSTNAPDVIFNSSQQVTLLTDFSNKKCLVTLVYASTDYVVRRDLWDDFAHLKTMSSWPWMAIGDFNCVLGAHEKRGGRLPNLRSCTEFKAMTETCEFVHLDAIGSLHTWARGGDNPMDLMIEPFVVLIGLILGPIFLV